MLFSKLKQYGFVNTIKRISKKILRNIGIQYDSYLVLYKSLTTEENVSKLAEFKVCELTNIKDFEPSYFDFSSEQKKLFEYRLSNNYKCYGAYEQGQLAYFCWISLKESDFQNKHYKLDLDGNDGLLLNAVCHPNVRGKGVHSHMNILRCNELCKYNKRNAIVVVLKDNIPALKTQMKSGFKIQKEIKILKIWQFPAIVREKKGMN